ncbi:hypothetical protein OH77DRAFT_875855 [Trametes cingulata]|nr:hypothetical protein OH77DRAFT_875855 [Trametes cingulata]
MGDRLPVSLSLARSLLDVDALLASSSSLRRSSAISCVASLAPRSLRLPSRTRTLCSLLRVRSSRTHTDLGQPARTLDSCPCRQSTILVVQHPSTPVLPFACSPSSLKLAGSRSAHGGRTYGYRAYPCWSRIEHPRTSPAPSSRLRNQFLIHATEHLEDVDTGKPSD